MHRHLVQARRTRTPSAIVVSRLLPDSAPVPVGLVGSPRWARRASSTRHCGSSGRCGRRATGSSCGIDEVGRGAWAGPVTVGAVVPAPEHLRGVRDSKQLTRPERERAARGGAAAGRSRSASGTRRTRSATSSGMTAALRAAGHARARRSSTRRATCPTASCSTATTTTCGFGVQRVTTVIKGDAIVPGGRGGVVRGEGDA